MGNLIVLEGLDGSGKETQANLLAQRLIEEGFTVGKLEYPNYRSRSSELVKMYLQGEISNDPEDINPYLASLFYTADRGISYLKDWKRLYEDDKTVFIADRYTTSNMLYQAAKIECSKERKAYLDWLWDLEFNKIKLPVPSLVIFLDVSNETTKQLTENRLNKINNGSQKDIHECNHNYQKNCYDLSRYLVEKYGWIRIQCIQEGKLLSKYRIHREIYKHVKSLLRG